MSERYSKLFSLPENLYAEGAPVIVSAGNLLKDNQTGKVLAQLKIKNIAAKPLKAATVLIHPQDAAGKPMADDTQQKYLDLTAKTGEEFGQKIAVFLADVSARGFSVEVTQAVFADNSIWEGTTAPWEPLPATDSLIVKLGDAELLKQYQLKFGGKCEFVPHEYKDLWLCACGAWNRDEKCYACGKGKEVLFSLDCDALRADKDARLAKEKAEREAKEAADKAAEEAKAKKTKKTLAIVLPLIAVCAVALLIITRILIPNSNYNKAKTLFDAGQYEEAISAFEALHGYKDSKEQLEAARNAKAEEVRIATEAERLKIEAQIEAENSTTYEKAERLIESGKIYEAALAFYHIKEYKDSWEQCFALWGKLTCRETLSAGGYHTVGVHTDGTVIAVGSNLYGQCDVKNWSDVVAVSAGGLHTLALRNDGTVLANGFNENGECNVEGWKDIVAVAAGLHYSLGLKADGTVIGAGKNDQGQLLVSEWKDIISLAAGRGFSIGLHFDGTVVATGRNEWKQCSLSDWNHVRAIAASGSQKIGGVHSVALLTDGSVLARGYSKTGECEVSEWKDIVAITAGSFITLGVSRDGTVFAVGSDYTGIRSGVADWKNVVAISAADFPSEGGGHAVALTSDGRVLAVGDNRGGQCDVSDWSDLKLPG